MADAEPHFVCPTCHELMERGRIVGRSPGVKFQSSQNTLDGILNGILGDLSGIPLTTGLFNHSADAWRCPKCGTVVVPPRRPD